MHATKPTLLTTDLLERIGAPRAADERASPLSFSRASSTSATDMPEKPATP
ncbi:hypothetical protein [Novosphingobium sp. BL-52-GroH]|uniref:hypothetical protein n=1 Tax=Novosphingobium sp. BL-52-GroH TaxID=3349877 RepID=UPI00384F0886